MTTFTHDAPGTSARAWAERTEWAQAPHLDLDGFVRVVVLAAHPDDETLGAGGLIASAALAGLDVQVVVCTAGEHSHPASDTHPPEVLAVRRKQELRDALRTMAPGAALTLVNLEDGRVDHHEPELVDFLVRLLGDARDTLVVAPWRHDGHPDHEATGRAAATSARRTGATLWEYPIWWWHWGRPDDAPWSDLRQLALSEHVVQRRAAGLAHHRSQTHPLSDAPGDEALLGPEILEHFAGDRERYLLQPATDGALDRLHETHDDPWQVDHSLYERRKRAVTLAMLPRDRFARALEIGCSVGALTDELAGRCDVLVAVDSSPAAISTARRRLSADGGRPGVELRCLETPAGWPEGTFDLIVLSEVGYFLSPRDLDETIGRIRDSLTPDGVVLLCHWRHPVVGWVLDGPRVHDAVAHSVLGPVQGRHVERDFEVLMLCADAVVPAVPS